MASIDSPAHHKLADLIVLVMDVEDEQHLLCSCPAYSDVRQKYANLFQQASSVSDFTSRNRNFFELLTLSLTLNQMHVVVFSDSLRVFFM